MIFFLCVFTSKAAKDPKRVHRAKLITQENFEKRIKVLRDSLETKKF